MARSGGSIEPNLSMKRYGLGDGYITVTQKGVSITITCDNESRSMPLLNGHDDLFWCESTIMVDPDLAPLFRMVANRLDEIAGKRGKR